MVDVAASKRAEAISKATEDDFRPSPEIGLAAQIEIDKLRRSGNPSHARLTLGFNVDCKKYLETMTKKLVERSPVQYPAIRQVR